MNLSFFRHFWHTVLAVAFDGPPNVGGLGYRFMVAGQKRPQLLRGW